MHARPFLDRAQERPEHGQELDVARDELGVFHAETVVDVDVAVDVCAWVFEFHCEAREGREREYEKRYPGGRRGEGRGTWRCENNGWSGGRIRHAYGYSRARYTLNTHKPSPLKRTSQFSVEQRIVKRRPPYNESPTTDLML